MHKKMGFKELLQQDIKNVFLNPQEFGRVHNVCGKEMTIVIDDNELLERKKRMQSGGDGTYLRQTVIYVSALDLGVMPAVGDIFTIDEAAFTVTDCVSEGGIYSIHLEDRRDC